MEDFLFFQVENIVKNVMFQPSTQPTLADVAKSPFVFVDKQLMCNIIQTSSLRNIPLKQSPAVQTIHLSSSHQKQRGSRMLAAAAWLPGWTDGRSL